MNILKKHFVDRFVEVVYVLKVPDLLASELNTRLQSDVPKEFREMR